MNLIKIKYASDERIARGGEGVRGIGVYMNISQDEFDSKKYFIFCRLRGGSDDSGRRSMHVFDKLLKRKENSFEKEMKGRKYER